LSTIDGSYGPFNVSIVSTNDPAKVAHEIVYDSNYEFGYIIVGTMGEPLVVTLDRESIIDNDIFG
jgi:presenilin-like A22 family membrane protease